jgi:hypothetical protein
VNSRTFSPKELEIIYGTIEHVAEHFYRQGIKDAAAGKCLKSEDFKLSKASRLHIKTNLNKTLQGR